MGRPLRNSEGGLVYHALNRGNAGLTVFEDDEDYRLFEQVLAEAVARHETRLLSYCIMPDHFHLVLWPRQDGDLSQFMRWLTMTHTQRWHAPPVGGVGAPVSGAVPVVSDPAGSADPGGLPVRRAEPGGAMA